MNSRIFPGIQGGPLEHVIAGKAVAFSEALRPDFKNHIDMVVKNAKALAEEMISLGFKLVTGGTDNRDFLVDLSDREITGKVAESALVKRGITVNKNTVPNEKRSPFVTSGVRIGTLEALTTRGMGPSEMKQIAKWISQVLNNPEDSAMKKRIHEDVKQLCRSSSLFIRVFFVLRRAIS